jgi:hypothetical protein
VVSGHRHHRGDLGVAEAGHGAGEDRNHEAQHDGGAGVVCGGLAGQYEDACTDDCAHAQQHEVFGGQGSLQTAFAVQAAFERFTGIDMSRRCNRLDPEQSFEHSQRPLARLDAGGKTRQAVATVMGKAPHGRPYLAKASGGSQARLQHAGR